MAGNGRIGWVVVLALLAVGCRRGGGDDGSAGAAGGQGGSDTSGYSVPTARTPYPGSPATRQVASTLSSGTMTVEGTSSTQVSNATMPGAGCAASEVDCGDGYCCPPEGRCIGGGQCEVPVPCASGTSECMYGGCCPSNGTCVGGLGASIQCEVPLPCGAGYVDCPDGFCCAEGTTCTDDRQCTISGCKDGDVDCGGYCCSAGDACAMGQCQAQCPNGAIDCGDGTCCPMGTRCDAGTCVPEDELPMGGSGGGAPAGGTGGVDQSACAHDQELCCSLGSGTVCPLGVGCDCPACSTDMPEPVKCNPGDESFDCHYCVVD